MPIMDCNKLIGIAEHPAKADKSAVCAINDSVGKLCRAVWTSNHLLVLQASEWGFRAHRTGGFAKGLRMQMSYNTSQIEPRPNCRELQMRFSPPPIARAA